MVKKQRKVKIKIECTCGKFMVEERVDEQGYFSTDIPSDRIVDTVFRLCSDCRKTQALIRVTECLVQEVGVRFHKASLDDYGEKKDVLIEYIDRCYRGGAGLHISGVENTGKTHLGAAFIRHLAEQYLNPPQVRNLWIRGREFYHSMQDVTYVDWRYKYLKSPIIFIDDAVVLDLRVGEKILGFIDDRYKEKLPTVTISNYTAKEIFEGNTPYGETIGRLLVSRILRDTEDEIILGG
jgi:hypothetical protein